MISADELAKMTDEQFLRYILEWSQKDNINFLSLLARQNLRRLQWKNNRAMIDEIKLMTLQHE